MAAELIVWTDDFSVNNKLIDDQHKYLCEIINRLYSSFIHGASFQIIKDTIDEIVRYADIHFKTEEDLLSEIKYPQLDQHIKFHQTFAQQVLIFEKDYNEGKHELSFEVMNFLADWLRNHILGEDKKFAPHVKFYNSNN